MYEVKLLRREEVAEGTLAFHLEKPRDFQFTAGQYLLMRLIDPPETDTKGDTRVFSIASAPVEGTLMIATRMRETAFKRVLKAMPLGTAVAIQGPAGSFLLHEDVSRPAVCLMGGIGITPARSMLLQATREQRPHRLHLFYSNRRPEDAAFLQELRQLERENPHYTFVGTMTDMEHARQPWQGETGYLTKGMLSKYLPYLSVPVYYIAGPPAMVTAMRTILTEAAVHHDQIRTEEFAGY